jgi:hypothetical protein
MTRQENAALIFDVYMAALTFFLLGLLIGLLIGAPVPAHAHWTGPTPAGAPDKPWWNGLHAQDSDVPCCDIANGQKVEDVDWDTRKGDDRKVHYRVRLDGQWIVVPDAAVVTVPNRFGPAVVWPYEAGGQTFIRCFMPGAGV